MSGLRLAVGLLTAFPVPPPSRVDRVAAGRAMALAPAVGLALALAVVLVGWISEEVGLGALLVAVLAVGVLAAGTRALHLDGLADTVDALGSGRSGAAGLEIMKRSDIGPFGVVALVFVVLLQVGGLAEAYGAGNGAAALVIAVVASRCGLAIACRRGVPAARGEGLGALVAGTVGPSGLAVAGGLTIVVAIGAAVVSDVAVWRALLAVALAAAAAVAVLEVCVRRFGGITGDVLGALAEIAMAVAVLALAA